MIILILIANSICTFEQKKQIDELLNFSLRNLENSARRTGESKKFLNSENLMFNGKIDDGQIYHVNYSHHSKVFGEMPISGEETIHAHEQKIILPKETLEIDETEETKLEEKMNKRRIGKGFLSVKSSIKSFE